MFASPLSALQLLLAVLGVLAAGESGALLLAGAVAAVLVAATLVVARTTARSAAAPRAPSPQRAIDVSVLLTQSDPDAPGASRPRAPGVLTAAA